jgi:hypothetical protein
MLVNQPALICVTVQCTGTKRSSGKVGCTLRVICTAAQTDPTAENAADKDFARAGQTAYLSSS